MRPVACALLLLALSASHAHAGDYGGAAYTGGDYGSSSNNSSSPRTPDAFVSGQGWGGSAGSTFGFYNGTNQSFSGGADCALAPLTATFTWMHHNSGETDQSDPPPPVIVMETTQSGWYASGPGATGKYSNPYKCPTTPASSGYGESENGTHYSTQPGMASLLVTGDLTASASGTGSVPGYQSLSAWVSYKVSVSPVTISLDGTLRDSNGVLVLDSSGNQQVLTGQQITAGLGGIPSGFTVTKYTWAVGGSTFKTYDPTLASNQLVPLASTDLTGPAKGSSTVAPLAFYDSAGETLSVSCAVTVLAPDGTSLNLTATSPPIKVYKPTLTNWGIAEGYVQYNPNTINGAAYGLYGNLNGATDASTNGMIWSNFTVNTPAPFSGNGKCTFTQIINPNRLGYMGSSSQPLVPNNGILGLDGSFEYGSPWNVTATGSDVDSPNQPIGYTGLTEISASDALTTYVMYQPSGGVWVPIDKFSWTWGVTLNWQNSQWNLTASYPQTAGQAGSPTPTTTTAPPQWTVVH